MGTPGAPDQTPARPGTPASGPGPNRPPDFADFWSATLEALGRVPCGVRREPAGPVRHGVVGERIGFRSLGGVSIRGYLLRHTGGGPRPLLVHGHGYGGRVQRMWPWARAGLDVVGVDVRGHGGSLDALPGVSPAGWMLTGTESPERHALRGAVCDFVRAVGVGRELVGGAPARTVLHGASFSGALALMAEALDPSADLLVAGVPSLGWAEGRRLLVRSGSGAEINRWLARRPEHAAEDLMVLLRYFDPVNFAGSVRCPTLVGVGLADEVVPAATVLAIAAHLAGPHEVMRLPTSHTGTLEERRAWRAFERRWLPMAASGLPDDFGATGDSQAPWGDPASAGQGGRVAHPAPEPGHQVVVEEGEQRVPVRRVGDDG
jgi:cephalosporin-C deacetylase